jgi:acyl-homoserine-lactone acylase
MNSDSIITVSSKTTLKGNQFFIAFICLILFPNLFLFGQERNYKEHVTIVRDQWGVPHIYGEKDVDVAYGLAWANAEDDFLTMQENLLPSKGMLGRWKGKKGATMDFIVQFLGSYELAKNQYEKEIGPEFKAYLEGYCKGFNDYAAAHPEEVKVKEALPMTPIDAIATYHYVGALITALQDQLKDVLEGKYDTLAVKFASNAFAVNGLKSENGNTVLVINPHVKFEGLFSWYEAHLVSEEGMNILGALFHGGTSVFVGTNENLGWAHTWNKYDLVDTYKLKMHPKNKLQYEYDGEWKTLEVVTAKMKVKVAKWLPQITVKKKFYQSVIGPTMASKKGEFYSLRWAAMKEVQTGEQWWKMNKAQNFEQFYEILKMNALPRFNIVYADKEQNLFYIDNGIVPKRENDFEWLKVLPGNTSKAVWTEFYKTEDLPQVRNPECGYVFNMNNTPFSATCDHSQIANGNWDQYMNYRTGDNNRSGRFMELIDEKEKVNFDDLKRIKFDNQYPKNGKFLESVNIINTVDVAKYPDLKDMILEMRNWNKIADSESVAATYFLLSIGYIFEKNHYSDEHFLDGFTLTEAEFIESVQSAKSHLMKYFKTLRVPLKQIQVIKRGDEEYAMPGFPDALAANYGMKRKSDGKYEGFVGDTYTMIVEYDKNGIVRLETLVNFGASAHKESKHYTDQLRLWVKQKTKTMTLNKEEILKNAERVYRPGK